MTKEEIEIIKIVFQSYLNIVRIFKKPNYISEEVVTELRDKLIKTLEQHPCEDCVNREDAKKFLYERLDRLNDDELYDIFSRIVDDMYNELPSETPQPKRGEWEVIRKEYEFMGGIVNESQGCKCSNCGGIVKFKSAFCPSCGSYNGGDKG